MAPGSAHRPVNGDAKDVAKLCLPSGQDIELPLLVDASGALFVDIRKLQPSTGICTFDPGFTSTGSCDSAITFIDGKKGVLLYRGHDIEQLADQGDFLDSAYLLLHGDLPSAAQKAAFDEEITLHTLVHEQLIQFFKGFKHDAHPMAIMVGVVGALSAFEPYAADNADPASRLRACMRLISRMPTLAALAYRTSMGYPLIYPRNDLDYAARLLHMMFAWPTQSYAVDPVLARALEKILILHMDHEQNASTSTVRTAGSSQANPFACMASGIAALWGPAHGGANEAVVRMLEDIGTPEQIPDALAKAKDKNNPFRLMGFGHRVYKAFDPRAKIMRKVCHEVLEHLQIQNDPLLEIAMELERVGTHDQYFVQRGLYPNVDFYSGIVLRALGIPVSMFTVLFAVARTVGWVAHWKEMTEQQQVLPKISRPRQMYNGHLLRPFGPLEERSGDEDPTELPKAQTGRRVLNRHVSCRTHRHM